VSSRTWTPQEAASRSARFAGDAWRAVEAQHIASTMALVDSLDEQLVLEELLDKSKPAVPVRATAGRIAIPRRHGSRGVLLRGRGQDRLRRAGILALAAPS
jgi:hypothetical protein